MFCFGVNIETDLGWLCRIAGWYLRVINVAISGSLCCIISYIVITCTMSAIDIDDVDWVYALPSHLSSWSLRHREKGDRRTQEVQVRSKSGGNTLAIGVY